MAYTLSFSKTSGFDQAWSLTNRKFVKSALWILITLENKDQTELDFHFCVNFKFQRNMSLGSKEVVFVITF